MKFKDLINLFGFRKSNRISNKTPNTDESIPKIDLTTQTPKGGFVLSSIYRSSKLTEKLGELIDNWCSNSFINEDDILNRNYRLKQINYLILNDPFIPKVIRLYADEVITNDFSVSCESLLSIEFNNYVNNLIANLFGYTLVNNTIAQLVAYGDAFWFLDLNEEGIKSVRLLNQENVLKKIEFNPLIDYRNKDMQNDILNFSTTNETISNSLEEIAKLLDEEDEEIINLSSFFDTKTFGYILQNNLAVLPWQIIHLKIKGQFNNFEPYGQSVILPALAQSLLVMSTIANQGLARSMSYPIINYKVKTDESIPPDLQAEQVNTVRQLFSNFTEIQANSEIDAINTKIWTADGLISGIEILKSEVDFKFIDDIKMYQQRELNAFDVPLNYFRTSEDGALSEKSAKALEKQNKPFRDRCFSLMNILLDAIVDTTRIHLAITEEFDYRLPFSISTPYKNTEELEDKQKVLDYCTKILDILKDTAGVESYAGLPKSVVKKVLTKFSSLSTTDCESFINEIYNTTNREEINTEKVISAILGEKENIEFTEFINKLRIEREDIFNLKYEDFKNTYRTQTILRENEIIRHNKYNNNFIIECLNTSKKTQTRKSFLESSLSVSKIKKD